MPNIDKHPTGTPCWFDLTTSNLDGARSFYAKLFGWTYDIAGPELMGYTTCKIGDRAAAGMGPIPPGVQMPSAWSVYFGVEDAEATIASIKSNGGTVQMGPMDIPEEGRMVVATDPTGAVFGLWQPKRHTGARVVNQHGAMAWQECFTRDVPRACEFYSKVFELEPTKIEMESMDYWILNRGKDSHGGIYTTSDIPADVPPHWLPYFAVDSADTSLTTLTTAGGKVIQPAFDTPYGRMAVVADPFGAHFAVIQLPKP